MPARSFPVPAVLSFIVGRIIAPRGNPYEYEVLLSHMISDLIPLPSDVARPILHLWGKRWIIRQFPKLEPTGAFTLYYGRILSRLREPSEQGQTDKLLLGWASDVKTALGLPDELEVRPLPLSWQCIADIHRLWGKWGDPVRVTGCILAEISRRRHAALDSGAREERGCKTARRVMDWADQYATDIERFIELLLTLDEFSTDETTAELAG